MAVDAWLDDLIDSAQQGGVPVTGQGGFLPEMVKAVLERGPAAELTVYLGYEQGDPAGPGSPNSRNGSTPKTLSTRLVPKGQRRLDGLDEQIISLYAGEITVRDIPAHLARPLGTELSHDTISKITDAVLDEVKARQSPFLLGDGFAVDRAADRFGYRRGRRWCRRRWSDRGPGDRRDG